MPRDLPLGNGSLLVAFGDDAQIHDLYFPHVGLENHSLGHPFRVGVWVDNQFRWFDDAGWQRSLTYQQDTLLTDVTMQHADLAVSIRLQSAVDFHEPLLVRRFTISNQSDRARTIRLFLQHDFHISGDEIGDTAYYEPERRAVLHYKRDRWFLINGAVQVGGEGNVPSWEPLPETVDGWVVGVHGWACGLKEIRNLEGTWRDAEDGVLSGQSVAHGSVDSTVSFERQIGAGEARQVDVWLAAGTGFEDVVTLNRMVRMRGAEHFLHRTDGYWRLWIRTHLPDLSWLPDPVQRLYRRSLLIIRTQLDNEGAVIAANDSDVASDVRDTYSYMWPRDGALTVEALTRAGYVDLPRAFFGFCQRALTEEGYLLHKYNPDGTLASSWLPWFRDGRKQLPIQEDETALVLWALWNHFQRFGDVEFIKPLYRGLITPAADFLAGFRESADGLPAPSYDLWEERHGVLTWTVAAVYGGLIGAAGFADAFEDGPAAERYRQAADQIQNAFTDAFWLPESQRFARMLSGQPAGGWDVDDELDASLVGMWKFGLVDSSDPRLESTMQQLEKALWVKTDIGGLARYRGDRYHQVSQDLDDVPGNPWFICTLWLAQWRARTAVDNDGLQAAVELLTWACQRALASGVLAEQVDPYSGAPLSVSPLTWSHAEFVNAVLDVLDARSRLATPG